MLHGSETLYESLPLHSPGGELYLKTFFMRVASHLVGVFLLFTSVKTNFQCTLLSLFFQNSSLSRTFKLFRALGLRHIVVVDENNEVSETRSGMISLQAQQQDRNKL